MLFWSYLYTCREQRKLCVRLHRGEVISTLSRLCVWLCSQKHPCRDTETTWVSRAVHFPYKAPDIKYQPNCTLPPLLPLVNSPRPIPALLINLIDVVVLQSAALHKAANLTLLRACRCASCTVIVGLVPKACKPHT